MASFLLHDDSIKLLSDRSKTFVGNNGEIVSLSETNKELDDIVDDFQEVAFKWILEAGYTGPTIACVDHDCVAKDYRKEFLCQRRIIRQTTMDELQYDGSYIHYILRWETDETDKDNIDFNLDKEKLPKGIPYECRVLTRFEEQKGLLHITLTPKIAMSDKPYFVQGEKGLFLKGKRIDMDAQSIALYRLFKKHTSGLKPSDVLTNEELLDEFLDYWKRERPGNEQEWCPTEFKNKIQNMIANNPKEIARQIHRMINTLNDSLSKTNDPLIAFHRVRQLHSKTKGAIYFIPIDFLNEEEVCLDERGRTKP